MTIEPKAAIQVPDPRLGVSLLQTLRRFGERGLATDERVDPPLYVVKLFEYPNNMADLEQLLTIIRRWLHEVGLKSVTIDSESRKFTVEAAQAPTSEESPQQATETKQSAAATRLYWKFEEGPEDATDGDPTDVGPAWIETADGHTSPVNRGEWITRAEARRLATTRGIKLEEDG